jgi:hypothetical protein
MSLPRGGPNVGIDHGARRWQWQPCGGGGGKRVLMSHKCDEVTFEPQLLDLAMCRHL